MQKIKESYYRLTVQTVIFWPTTINDFQSIVRNTLILIYPLIFKEVYGL